MNRAWPRTRVSRGAFWRRFFTPSRHWRTMRSLRSTTAAMSISTGPAFTPKRGAPAGGGGAGGAPRSGGGAGGGGGGSRYMEHAPLLGGRRRPGSSVTYRHGEFTVEVNINRLGLRDPERGYSAPPGCLRILALADSFVKASTVPLPQTVSHGLKAHLQA